MDQSAAGQPRREPAGSAGPKAARGEGGLPFQLYKPGQGQYVRWGTAAGAGLIVVALANFLYEELRVWFPDSLTVPTLAAVGVLALGAWLTFKYIGQNRTVVDFMIATEGEMKKVNWSTRREVLGATRVVIFTVIALSLLLFIADLFFVTIFSGIGVVQIDIWGNLFGTGTG